MSDYQEFLAEREQMDLLIGQGYRIVNVTENLSGAFVDFISKKDGDLKQLHIKTADGRKYFSIILLNK
ncbi:hypothetical protein [Bacillus sp. V5-8f]|uniref:hypothetical protein n=1 Tax=Bacillus sp. V5-8f TaxID=2053044 RepID=UPI000C75777C|nr:hypothetical protein [Bacillus sp. V5-8f]PLT35433.1 hypothetical protein CUU64_02135 [Bacillus sp. V5-8f]